MTIWEMLRPRPRLLFALLLTSTIPLACADSSSDDPITESMPETTDPRNESTSPPEAPPGEMMRGLRYCEVLLLDLGDNGLQAEVYNTYPLNDCADEVWRGLDAAAIAQTESVPFAVLNGPRYWLMDAVERVQDGSVITKSFGGSAGSMEMNRYAVVLLGTPDVVGKAYTEVAVDRKARFSFRAGSEIYVLVDPNGSTYVMQSWSQQRDPSLTASDLPALADRLDLPQGWSFQVETLDEDLIVDTSGAPARVLTDELNNTYSWFSK